MKKRNLIIASVLAVITLTAVPLVYAQHYRSGFRHGAFADFGFGHLRHAREYLDLSDAQVDQLKEIAADLHKQNAPYRDQLHGGLVQVAQTLINDPNNVGAAKALLDQQNAAENTMKANALNAASKALNILTPDQRAKVADFVSKRAAMHKQQ